MCQFETPIFVYYSHAVVLVLTLLMGFFILFKDKNNPINRNAFYIILVVALWIINDFGQWTVHSVFWNTLIVRISFLADLIFLFFLYFAFHFANIKISLRQKLFLAVPYVFLLGLAFTRYGIQVFNTSDCDYAHTKVAMSCCYFLGLSYAAGASYILWKYYKKPITSYRERLQIRVLLPAIWIYVFWIIINEEMARISFLNGTYIDNTPHFIIGNLFFVSLIAFAMVKVDLFNFWRIPKNGFIIFIWSLIFVGMFAFPMNTNSIIISGIAYFLLMIAFLKI